MGARSQRKRIVSKPFPGLRPFLRDENLIFFGREGQTDELIARLKRNHFLAVLGASGSGKSSMVRAGLLPALEGGLMAGARAKWKMAVFRPGDRPIHEMALALSGLINAAEDPSFQVISPLEMISTMLDASSYGLKEAALGPILREDENLLVVVDQFEEIFRFQEENTGESKVDEAKAFIKLLLEASSDPNLPIYVVITMRSDFLGECPRFRHLPEAINAGQYLVPRLPRSQMRPAITGPVAVFGEAFAPDLVIRLLNDVGEAQDQLPILQHALMRTWDHHTPGTEVGVKDYEAIGGLENALNQHAEEIFAELEAKGLGEATGFVFSCLTQTESDGKGIRRPARFSDICASTGLEAESVKTIVEAFRASGRSFLMPPVGVALEPETIIDISHESFMRLWTRLEAWVEEESRSAEEYRKLSHAATEHALGKVNLWRMPELGIALKWKDENQPSAEWASRYDQNFEAAMAFLAASQKAWKAEEEEKAAMLVVQQQAEKSEKELRRQKLTTRGLAAMVVVLLMAVGAAIYYAYEASAQEQKARASTYAALSTSEKLLVQKDSLILKNNEILAATKENKRLQTEKDSIENSKTIYITALNDTLTKNNKH